MGSQEGGVGLLCAVDTLVALGGGGAVGTGRAEIPTFRVLLTWPRSQEMAPKRQARSTQSAQAATRMGTSAGRMEQPLLTGTWETGPRSGSFTAGNASFLGITRGLRRTPADPRSCTEPPWPGHVGHILVSSSDFIP